MSYAPKQTFFWNATKTWAQLWAEVVAGGTRGTIVVEPTAFPGLSVTAGTYDFTNIRFQGYRESSATSFGSTIQFASGALIDGGAYVALRGDAMVFFVTTALMTPSAKRVILELTGGSRLFRSGDNIVFDSSSPDTYWSIINSSVAGAGTTNPLYNMSSASARMTAVVLNAITGVTLPTRCFGGVLGSAVLLLADNFGGRAINTNTVQAPAVWSSPSSSQAVSNSWGIAGRPAMPSGFGDGTLGYNRDAHEYEHWDAIANLWVPHPVDRVGTDIVSATTIAPTARIHAVTGSATIDTITPLWTGFIGDITLLKPVGETWSLTTGGNIAVAVTPTAGYGRKLTYNGTLWYPQE